MDKLNIPKKIHVGYQKRSDTYTGKLAYIIYTDAKGKKRKEPSWNSWRDKTIDQDDFDNEPMSGFVLNKGVGGQRESWGWNARNEYIRVFDPRGFEFEISVANLLFILTNCTATKGKGLEGEFVYSWDRTDLILLPVDCFEYRASTEFTDLQTKKVTKKDMKEGRTYQHKNMETLVYLGRHKIRDLDKCYWNVHRMEQMLQEPDTFRHVFWDVNNNKWHFERGFTKLATVVSEDSHDDFANLYTKFTSSEYMSEVADIVLSPITAAQAEAQKGNFFFIKVEAGYQLVYVTDSSNYYWGGRSALGEGMTSELFWPRHPTIFREVNRDNVRDSRSRYYGYRHYDDRHSVSASYIQNKELLTPEIKLKSRKKIEVENYVKRR